MTPRPPLILASTSRYRRELLERLRLPFDVVSPQVDETPHPGESPAELAVRLAAAKAAAVAALHPQAVVIGSDQVAELDGTPIGKPGSHERAVAQLRAMRGRSAIFHTAVAVQRAGTSYAGAALAPVTVRFRDTGPGVQNPTALFRPFQPGVQSTGLGLYVSRAIVRTFGGDLSYEEQEKGACFAVSLPLSNDGEPGGYRKV